MITLKGQPIPIHSILEYMVSVQTTTLLIRTTEARHAMIFTYDTKEDLYKAVNMLTDTLKGQPDVSNHKS